MYNFYDILCCISILFSYLILIQANDNVIPYLNDDNNVTDYEIQSYNNTSGSQDDLTLFAEEKDDIGSDEGKPHRKLKDIVIMTTYEKAHKKPCQEVTSTESSCNYDDIIVFYNHNKTKIIIIAIVLAQLFVLIIAGYCYRSGCQCTHVNEKKLERKYFNNNPAVSITTPLIYTSKSDTETTEFEYDNYEDKKFKKYNSLQCSESKSVKEIQVNEDIINKCKNRRNWRQAKSDTIPKRVTDENMNETEELYYTICNENDEYDYNSIGVVNVQGKTDKCDYSRALHSYSAHRCSDPNSNLKLPPVTNVEAQACFSDDTLDNIIKNKGIHINEQNLISDCCSNEESKESDNLSECSSKIGNGRFKKMPMYIEPQFGSCSKSDPGVGANEVELLHISQSYSSSDNTDTCLRTITIKKNGDSRTSL